MVNRLTFSPLKYWEKRAKEHGEYSVLHLGHDKGEIQKVKAFQIETIFPVLVEQLNGDEKTLLDFGCGPGRFTIELADAIKGHAMGVDPIEHLLQLAPQGDNVSYKKIIDSTIPASDESFDVIWICLVLGGLVSNKQLARTVKEINRVSKDNALLILIENTTNKKNTLSWAYRSRKEYIQLFKNFNLKHFKDYDDLGECISIFAGRKISPI